MLLKLLVVKFQLLTICIYETIAPGSLNRISDGVRMAAVYTDFAKVFGPL